MKKQIVWNSDCTVNETIYKDTCTNIKNLLSERNFTISLTKDLFEQIIYEIEHGMPITTNHI